MKYSNCELYLVLSCLTSFTHKKDKCFLSSKEHNFTIYSYTMLFIMLTKHNVHSSIDASENIYHLPTLKFSQQRLHKN